MIKFEGSYDPGSIDCVFAYDPNDAGQQALIDAHNGGGYNFKYTLTNGEAIYFRAYVPKCAIGTGGDGDDHVMTLNVILARDKGIAVMAPAPEAP
ncbi:hypothetical protein DLJ53_27600 [Acuticoccus sediminis]|uniref:Uncharacterized protein n=2 Tax=Acuticoccus sediminis TaxID=2184697 RepID=A0A8B2NPB5_9HYPH|nr:hypothetical protein DLJ53_27600 [Acuticoccus sediminis]